MHDLSGRTVLVTGASKGIGAATAATLGDAGAHVIAHYGSDREGAAAAIAAIPDARRCVLQADLAQPDAARALWRAAVAWRGGVDVLVNNAAIMVETPLGEPDDAWDRDWDLSLRVNVLAPAALMREAVGHFRARGGGVLITLSSWVAQRGSGNPDLLAYAASKGAIKALTQTLARAHARENVLAYLVAPGVVDTRMSRDAAARQGGEAAVTASLAMGEWVPPEEIADAVAYLASGTCRHLTGATLDINGASYVR
jgi:NAD(P)-dependent dehydrogenase (short-subunit alcohol dehydrogenase family)